MAVLNGGHTYRFTLSAAVTDLAGWLAAAWDHTDRAGWEARIVAGEIGREGSDRRVGLGEVLRAGERLWWRRPPWEEPDAPQFERVLFEDAHLIAVEKPSGLACMPAGGLLEATLLYQVRRRWPEAAPMHRLGRGTSGIVLYARTGLARSAVQRAWREGRVEKVYRALAEGVTPERFVIDLPIGPVPHARLGTVFAAVGRGAGPISETVGLISAHMEARSEVFRLEVRAGAAGALSLVDVAIDTGRPHQIRAHLSAAGWPLWGDPLYVAGGGARAEVLPGALGYWLHARRLALAHPETGERLEILSVPPPPLVLTGGLELDYAEADRGH